MNAELHSRKVLKFLLICYSILLVGNLLSIILKLHFGLNSALMFVPLFNFNFENNLPTFFNALELLLAAILLSVILPRIKFFDNERWFS